jgi:hypothetical protein
MNGRSRAADDTAALSRLDLDAAEMARGASLPSPRREGRDHPMGATRYFIVSGLPLCLVAPDAGRRLARGDEQGNHQSDYDPFDEL